MNYSPGKVISEQNHNYLNQLLSEEELKGGSDQKDGVFNVTNTPFKNKGMFSEFEKNETLYVCTAEKVGAGPKGADGYTPEVTSDTETTTKEPQTFKFPFSVSDPFVFDDDVLTPEGETALNNFITTINGLEKDPLYTPESVNGYYEFLKQQEIPVYGYASIDSLSNFKLTFTSSKTSCSENKEYVRKDYNKCLSQVRAQKIVDKLKESGGILSQLKYKPVGRGETNAFSKKTWDNNVQNPKVDKKSPFSNEDTKPDRKFIIMLPTFNYTEPVKGDENKTTATKTTNTYTVLYNPEALKIINKNPEYVQGKREHIDIKGQNFESMMSQYCIKYDPKAFNKQMNGNVGELIIMDNDECFNKEFDISDKLNSELGIQLPSSTLRGKTISGTDDVMFKYSDIETSFGKDFINNYLVKSMGDGSSCSLTKNNITIGGVSWVMNGTQTQRKFVYESPTLANGTKGIVFKKVALHYISNNECPNVGGFD